MGRFSEWAKTTASADAAAAIHGKEGATDVTAPADIDDDADGAPKLERYLVDNSSLNSRSGGLRLRKSFSLADKDLARPVVPWGTVVAGVRCRDRRWLQVGERFLPTHVGRAPVLLRVTNYGVVPPDVGFRSEALSGAGASATAEVDDVASDGGDSADDGAALGGGGVWAASATGLPAWMLGTEPAKAPQGRRRRPVASAPAPPRWMNSGSPLPPSAASAAPGGSQAGGSTQGRGRLYAVVAERAVVRSAPSTRALVENWLPKGRVVELFERDETREWRRCFEANANRAGQQPGWMRLRHPQTGGRLLSRLEPVCAAAYRDEAAKLRRLLREVRLQGWQGASGCHPVRLAVVRGALRSCAVLACAGGGSAFEKAFEDGCHFPWALDVESSKALVAALSGRNFDLPAYDRALAALPSAEGELAERLFDDAAAMIGRMRSIADGGEDMHLFGEAGAFEVAGGGGEAEDDSDSSSSDFGGGASGAAGVSPSLPSAAVGGVASPMAPAAAAEKGELYRVVQPSVFVRRLPTGDADALASRPFGAEVALFEFDESRRWRRVRLARGEGAVDAESEAGGRVEEGWILLEHPSLGALLEPVASAAAAAAASSLGARPSAVLGTAAGSRRSPAAPPGGARAPGADAVIVSMCDEADSEDGESDGGRDRDGWAALMSR